MQGYYIAEKEVWFREASTGILVGIETHWILLDDKLNGKEAIFVTCHFGDSSLGQEREEGWGELPGVVGVIREIDDILTDEPMDSEKMDLVKSKVGAVDTDSARAVIKKAAAVNKSMKFRRF